MEKKLADFIQNNSPDGGFLQSVYWRKFQESVGRKTFNISEENEDRDLIAYANIITHKLPVAGKYFYIPRGPVAKIFNFQFSIFKQFINDLISIAQKNNAGWIRIEPANDEILNLIKENLPKSIKIKKSSVDMQPREILILDISRGKEEILAGMKQKTRYNIKLAQKRGVSVQVISNFQFPISKQYIDGFVELVKITAERDKIKSHTEDYYRKMFEVISGDILKLYVAEYEGKIIAANLVLFFGEMATYMHGASDNVHRDAMAPYLLQWRQMLDAKKAGCEKYDFGGVKTEKLDNSWAGITKFKTGFAPDVKPIKFPGSYDIVLNPFKYNLYRILQRIKRVF